MENDHLIPTDTQTENISEVVSLLRDTLERRPYQAYCTTEASSRPSSPDQFVPSPLRLAKVHSHQIDVATQALHIDSSGQGDSLDHNATDSAEKHLGSTKFVSKKEHSEEIRHGMTRKASLNSVSPVTSDHIAPLNITRGGHSLTKGGVTVYDQISLSPQLQPSRNVDGAKKHEITRNPMPYNEGSVIANRPSTPRDLDLASQTSHRNSCETSLNNSIPLKARPKSALYLSPDIQNGPRPPPWGSDDDLALQRRIRSELRERSHILAGDTVTAPTSNYRKLHSDGRLSEGLSREVEEYRQQILRVYPDMTLDGNAGKDEGRWPCCVVI